MIGIKTYKILDGKTDTYTEIDETAYTEYINDFKNNDISDLIVTETKILVNGTDVLNNYNSEKATQPKESIINAAKEYIDLYKKSDYTIESSTTEVSGNSVRFCRVS